MSSAWHWFVVAGTLVSLAAMVWLLYANRRTSGEETTGHEWDGIHELDNPLPMWWVWMFMGSVVFAVLYLFVFPGLGNFDGALDWSSSHEHDAQVAAHDARFAPLYAEFAAMSPDALADDRRAQQVGRRLYLNHCAACHGVAARGSFGFPNLTDDAWIWGGEFDTVKATILDGRTAVMTPWQAVLGDDGVLQTAHYVRKLSDQEHDTALADAGEKHFATICIACHGADGRGMPALGAPDLTDAAWLYGGDVEQISFTIRHGRTGVMPGFADILGEEKAHVLAGYVKALTK